MGHRQAARVIGNCNIFETALTSLTRHILDRCASVGVPRMGVKVAAKVFTLNQFGQLAGRGGFYFAAVLAQLWWHPRKLQGAVNLFFRSARDDRIAAKEAVLVEQESARLSDAPQMHVVRSEEPAG